MLMPNGPLLEVELADSDAGIGAGWRELARRATFPAGPHSPELAMPALGLAPGAALGIVRDAGGLQCVMPLPGPSCFRPCYAGIVTPVTLPALPLVGEALAEPALAALLRHLGKPLLLQSMPENGPLWQALANASGRMTVLDRWRRAALRPEGSFDAWFESSFDRKRRKEFRRLQARLAEQGRFKALSLPDADDVGLWTEAFLKLEASGWKGRRGTAIHTSEAASAALRAGLRDLAQSGKLRFWKLALDGQPIAMLFGIVDRREAWLFKIAHDETFARYSPGVLLILHATEKLFQENVTLADSCAIPDHPMIDRIWRDRIAMADVLVAPREVSASHFAMTAAGLRLRKRTRRLARDVWYRLSGRRAS